MVELGVDEEMDSSFICLILSDCQALEAQKHQTQ